MDFDFTNDTIIPTVGGNINISSIGALRVAAGTTGEEPAAVNGMVRYDTTTNKLRAVENGVWTDVIGGSGVTEPSTQIVYGTGSGVDSSSTLTYNVTTGALTLNPGAVATPGAVSITSASASVSGAGGSISIIASPGVGTNQNGGAVTVQAGAVTGTGTGSTITFNTNGANQRLQLTQAGSAVLGSAAVAASATDGFLYIVGCGGQPTGVPTTFTGRAPVVYDETGPMPVLWGRANPSGATPWRPVAAQQSIFIHTLVDEFSGGSITSDSIGQLSWSQTAAGTPTISFQDAVTDHPGIIRLATGATSGNNTRIHLGDGVTNDTFMANQVAEFTFIVRVPTITSIIVKVGLTADASDGAAATFGADGVWIEFSSAADASWRCYTRSGGASSAALDSAVNVTANNWYVLRAVRNSTTSWEFFINGTSVGTRTTNLPTTSVNVAAIVQTATTAARTLDVDYFRIVTEVMGSRFT